MPFPNIQQGTAYEDDDDESFPRVDVYERGPEIVAIFEIPGVARASDISLSVRSDHIYVRGTIAEAGFRADHVIISERHHGPFERHVPLPVRVIADRVNATYRNGLLMVRLEKYGQDDPESQNFVTIQFEDDSDNQTRSRGK
jgi:HSP20 family protein